MRTRGIAAGCFAALLLGLAGSAVAQQDYSTLPTEYNKVAKMLAEKKLDLASIIRTAEKRLQAKVLNTIVGIEDEKLKIAVDLSASGISARVEIDPETGKLASTTDKFYDCKVSLLDAIATAEKRTGGKVTGAVIQPARTGGGMNIVVRLSAPGIPSLFVTIHPETGKVTTAPSQQLPDENLDVMAAVRAAEKDAKGVATNVSAKGAPGKSEVTVTIVGDKIHKRVKVDPATNKVLSSEDLAMDLPGDPVEGKPTTTKTGLTYYDIKEGKGDPLPPTSSVKVDYTGWFVDGKKFDSSLDPKGGKAPQPMTVDLRRGTVAGFLEGLRSMKVGGKRKLVIPYKLAYKERGNQRIPPKATLIFDVEVLEVMPAMPPATMPAGGRHPMPIIRPAPKPAP